MANFHDHDDKFAVADFVNDSVGALTNSIPFLRGKLYASLSTWIIPQSLDPFQDTRNVLLRDAS